MVLAFVTVATTPTLWTWQIPLVALTNRVVVTFAVPRTGIVVIARTVESQPIAVFRTSAHSLLFFEFAFTVPRTRLGEPVVSRTRVLTLVPDIMCFTGTHRRAERRESACPVPRTRDVINGTTS